jgi:thiamine phosphate synthase YjbQ (UPF0047 family)
LDECNKPKKAIPVKDCKNIPAGYKKKVHVHTKHDPNSAHITEILYTLKQRLSVKSQRLRLFTTNEKTSYHNLKSE